VHFEQRQPILFLVRLTVERPANGSSYSIDFSVVHNLEHAAPGYQASLSESGVYAQKCATDIHAEVDLKMKAIALTKCDVLGKARIKRWHRDPGVITS
jgi:hypothetical protein